jgi:hypothetical protein
VIAVELGSATRTARLVFAVLLVSILVFGSIAVGLRDPFALLLCAVSVLGAVRLGMVLRRRSRARGRATTVVRGRTSTVVHDGLFTARGRYSVGGRSREGLLLIGPERAGFIPLGHWRFLVLQLLLAPFVAQIHFVDLEIETTSEGVDPAILDAIDTRACSSSRLGPTRPRSDGSTDRGPRGSWCWRRSSPLIWPRGGRSPRA